jgi:hypothetical protein
MSFLQRGPGHMWRDAPSSPVAQRARLPAGKPAPPLSGAERQRRYRTSRDLVPVDISGATNALLRELRDRLETTSDVVVTRALHLLRADLDRPARREKPRRPPRTRLSGPSADTPAPNAGDLSSVPPSPEMEPVRGVGEPAGCG